MCGIVGATSDRNVVPILIEGIRRLEYRGYDSTGLAVVNGGASPVLERLVSTARVADLAAQADALHLDATTGISHTRWATHGAPTSDNAHPHLSGGEIAVVHNGIIENYEALRDKLIAQGYVFRTQTDTEVIAHLVHWHWHRPDCGDLLAAVRRAIAEFKGAYAIAVISTRERGRVVGARQGSPLLVGIGDHDHFLASDASALMAVTRRVAYLEEGDVADVRREGYAIFNARGERASRRVVEVQGSGDAVELGPYRHYMQKEIFEQPRAVADTLDGVAAIGPELFGDNAAQILPQIDSVLTVLPRLPGPGDASRATFVADSIRTIRFLPVQGVDAFHLFRRPTIEVGGLTANQTKALCWSAMSVDVVLFRLAKPLEGAALARLGRLNTSWANYRAYGYTRQPLELFLFRGSVHDSLPSKGQWLVGHLSVGGEISGRSADSLTTSTDAVVELGRLWYRGDYTQYAGLSAIAAFPARNSIAYGAMLHVARGMRGGILLRKSGDTWRKSFVMSTDLYGWLEQSKKAIDSKLAVVRGMVLLPSRDGR